MYSNTMSAVSVYLIKPGSLANPWQSWQSNETNQKRQLLHHVLRQPWDKSCSQDNCHHSFLPIPNAAQMKARPVDHFSVCQSCLPPVAPPPSSSFVSVAATFVDCFHSFKSFVGEDLMSLPWSSNLQIDRQTHLRMCKAEESAAKEKVIYEHGYKSVGIRGSNSLENWMQFWEPAATPLLGNPCSPFSHFPPGHPAIDHLKASMHVVLVWSFLEPTSLPRLCAC